MPHRYLSNDITSVVHGPMVKGVALAMAGLGTSVYAGIQHLMSAAPALADFTPTITATDLSGILGTGMALSGSAWTWWLYSQGKQADHRRAQEKADADLRREIEVQDRLARIQADQAEHMAKIRVMIAAQKAHLDSQDQAIEAVKQAVTPDEAK
jgi:hypothetical protein